ncbi:MAG TPA: PilN domain-containing protein, partial [Thermodesulfobacteriota bacterium]|nr:PilN domain-containing protein [Thermodesulfobacteriota bacterium]
LLESLSVAASKDPDARIRVNEISMAEGRIRASGEAASFEAANRFKESLAKDARLKNVQLTDLKSKTGGGAAFSLSMTVL